MAVDVDVDMDDVSGAHLDALSISRQSGGAMWLAQGATSGLVVLAGVLTLGSNDGSTGELTSMDRWTNLQRLSIALGSFITVMILAVTATPEWVVSVSFDPTDQNPKSFKRSHAGLWSACWYHTPDNTGTSSYECGGLATIIEDGSQ